MSILELKDKVDIVNSGDPTGWADITAEITERGTGANNPPFSTFRGGINCFTFSATAMMECFASFHIPHTYKAGTPVYFHTHWAQSTANTGTVRWGFEYTFARGYAQEAFPATQTVYVEQAGSSTQYMHMIAETTAITIPNLEVDGILLVRIFRDAAHGNDTNTQTAALITADIHIEVDRVATKNRNFPFYT